MVVSRVRVLLDYRPALRQRSGVGEYDAPTRPGAGRGVSATRRRRELDLTLFSSSWKDRLNLPVRTRGGAVRRSPHPGPSAQSCMASPRLAAGRSARRARLRRGTFAAPAAAAGAPRRTSRHDSRSGFPRSSRAHRAPRFAATTARSCGHTRTAPIAARRRLEFTAGEVERRLGVAADRIAVCPHGRAATGRPRPAAPRDGYMLFFGTLEPRKNVGGAARCVREAPRSGERSGRWTGCASARAGRNSRPMQRARWLDRLSRPPLAGHVRAVGYVDPDAPPGALRRRAPARPALLRGRLRHAGARSDDARRAGRGIRPWRAAGSPRRRRPAGRSGSAGRLSPPPWRASSTTSDAADGTRPRASRARASSTGNARLASCSPPTARGRAALVARHDGERSVTACGLASTPASWRAVQPASGDISPACSANGPTAVRSRSTNSSCTRPSRWRLSTLAGGFATAWSIRRARGTWWEQVRAAAGGRGRPPRRLLCARIHGAPSRRRADRRHDPRSVVRRAPGMVSAARGHPAPAG